MFPSRSNSVRRQGRFIVRSRCASVFEHKENLCSLEIGRFKICFCADVFLTFPFPSVCV